MFSLVDVILPKRCAYCREALPRNSGVFCVNCQIQIKMSDPNDQSSLVVYAGLIRTMIVAAKFKPDEAISRQLARFLAMSLLEGEHKKAWESCSAVTYVPSHFRRRISRGHDVPAIFASTIARIIKKPLTHTLRCTRFDPPISSSSSHTQRLAAVSHRFQCDRIKRESSHVLLIDDVLTTGATLQSAQSVLEEVGYRVSTFAFARTSLSRTTTLNK